MEKSKKHYSNNIIIERQDLRNQKKHNTNSVQKTDWCTTVA